MKISITHENKSDKYWQDCTVTIPDGSSIHEIVSAIADCLVGSSFSQTTVHNGFDEYLEGVGYYNEQEEDENNTGF
jgi:hypothetical protein